MTDQYLRMQYSDDGGRNVTNWREEPIGEAWDALTNSFANTSNILGVTPLVTT